MTKRTARAQRTQAKNGAGAAPVHLVEPMLAGMTTTRQHLLAWVHAHGLAALDELFRAEASPCAWTHASKCWRVVVMPASIGSTRCTGAAPAPFFACVRCALAVLFVIGGSLAPVVGTVCLGRRDSHADQGVVATQFSSSTGTGTSPRVVQKR